MSILRSIFTGTVTLYTIQMNTSSSTGIPVETLVSTGTTIDIAETKSRVVWDNTVNGNVKLEDFRFIAEQELNPQTTVVEKDGVKYRIKSKLRKGLNNKTFGYEYSCFYY